MPDKKGRFTGREKVFIERYASTGDAVYAAEKAGYSSPRQAASQNANNPAIVAECQRRVQHQLATEILPAACKRHAMLLQDEKQGGQVLIRAIDLAYKHGLVPAFAGGEKEPHEMTADEIQREINRLYREASDRAALILEHQPKDCPPEHVAPEARQISPAANAFD